MHRGRFNITHRVKKTVGYSLYSFDVLGGNDLTANQRVNMNVSGGGKGARVGLFSYHTSAGDGGTACFDWFTYSFE